MGSPASWKDADAAFLYGSERVGEATGRVLLAAAICMMTAFPWTARRKGDAAAIDLRLFRVEVFSAAAITQFLSNGGTFAGLMLIPALLLQAYGRTPGEMGWMLAPLGIGMMLVNPMMGALTDRFGIRRVSAGGAHLTLIATMPVLYLARYGLDLFVLLPALLLRGDGSERDRPAVAERLLCVGAPTGPADGNTSLNVVQRLGGPALTTLCATVLAWRLADGAGHGRSSAYAWAFVLLCGIHALTFVAALRLPLQ